MVPMTCLDRRILAFCIAPTSSLVLRVRGSVLGSIRALRKPLVKKTSLGVCRREFVSSRSAESVARMDGYDRSMFINLK
jgi:hypothetical protein